MNTQNEIRIADFQSQSMRKFMQPLYWQLRHAEKLADEEKSEVVRKTIWEFFKRLRMYRNISIEEMSEQINFSIEEIEAFEIGNLKSRELEEAYFKKCHAWFEREYFDRRIRECMKPEIRDSKKGMARDLVKRFGILLPDVDLSRLNSAPADVIDISSRFTTKVQS